MWIPPVTWWHTDLPSTQVLLTLFELLQLIFSDIRQGKPNQ
jgi:hypothetical protein